MLLSQGFVVIVYFLLSMKEKQLKEGAGMILLRKADPQPFIFYFLRVGQNEPTLSGSANYAAHMSGWPCSIH